MPEYDEEWYKLCRREALLCEARITILLTNDSPQTRCKRIAGQPDVPNGRVLVQGVVVRLHASRSKLGIHVDATDGRPALRAFRPR